jgi:hypothetical protein
MENQLIRYARLLMWFTISATYILLMGRWVSLTMHDRAFADYLGHVVDSAAVEQRPAKEVRALLMAKAEDLSLPVQEQGIQITGGGESLRAVVRYEADLILPVLDRSVYRFGFEHDLSYQR